MATCPTCGFALKRFEPLADQELIYGCVYDERKAPDAAGSIISDTNAIAGLFDRVPAARLLDRAAGGWSALEHGCHLRDVIAHQRERCLRTMRGFGSEPLFMGREERVQHDSYQTQSPTDVAVQLRQWTKLLTDLFDRLDEATWALALTYSFPAPASRSLRWLAVHTAHEARHHRADIDSLVSG